MLTDDTYSIGEVSELLGLKEHVLRFWEKEFKELCPQKSSKGRREYRKKDIDMIFTIQDLLYKQEFTLSGAKKQLLNLKVYKSYKQAEPQKEAPRKEEVKTEKTRKTLPPLKNTSNAPSILEKKGIITELHEIIKLLE